MYETAVLVNQLYWQSRQPCLIFCLLSCHLQLEQVTAALAATPDNQELRQLAASLTELIGLTQQHSAQPGQRSAQPAGQDRSSCRNGDRETTSSTGQDGSGKSAHFDDEMALFKVS